MWHEADDGFILPQPRMVSSTRRRGRKHHIAAEYRFQCNYRELTPRRRRCIRFMLAKLKLPHTQLAAMRASSGRLRTCDSDRLYTAFRIDMPGRTEPMIKSAICFIFLLHATTSTRIPTRSGRHLTTGPSVRNLCAQLCSVLPPFGHTTTQKNTNQTSIRCRPQPHEKHVRHTQKFICR